MTEYLENGNLKDVTHNSTTLKVDIIIFLICFLLLFFLLCIHFFKQNVIVVDSIPYIFQLQEYTD